METQFEHRKLQPLVNYKIEHSLDQDGQQSDLVKCPDDWQELPADGRVTAFGKCEM